MRSQRKTISLNKAQVTFMDAYGKRHAGKSRSEVVAEALLLLRQTEEKRLEAAYSMSRSADRSLARTFAMTAGDGLMHEEW